MARALAAWVLPISILSGREARGDPEFIFALVPTGGSPAEGRDTVRVVKPGEAEISVDVLLISRGLDTGRGPSGWSVGIRHDPRLRFAGTTDAGWPTVSFIDGLHVSVIHSSGSGDEGPYDFDLGDLEKPVIQPGHHFMSCVAVPAFETLDRDTPIVGAMAEITLMVTAGTFLLANDTSTVLRIVYDVPSAGTVETECRISFENGLYGPAPVEGGTCGPPRSVNAVTYLGKSATVTERGLVLRIPAAGSFIRGDASGDGIVDLSDAIGILQFLFLGGQIIDCPDAADVDDDGGLDITDAIVILRRQFLGTGPLPAPYPACGTDPTEDSLGPCAYTCP